MATWSEFTADVPDFATRVQALFSAHRHHTMATVRKDGSPRISGTEVSFEDGQLSIGMMAGARRVEDLRRDPRLAIHSHCVDPPEGDPSGWCGEAKVTGRAVETPGGEEGSHLFRVDISDVVVTGIGTPADHLVIEWWRPQTGLTRIERH